MGTDLYPHMPILHNAHNHYPVAAEHARWLIRPISGFTCEYGLIRTRLYLCRIKVVFSLRPLTACYGRRRP